MAQKTPISMLQELMVSRHEAIPQYEFESVGDLLNPKFSCTVKTSTINGVAVARNKKEAKQAAAENALKQILNLETLNCSNKETQSTATNNNSIPLPGNYVNGTNYVGMLNQYIQSKRNVLALNYTETLLIHSNQFEVTCILDEQSTVGCARNKKEAKQIAAFHMLESLQSSKYSLKPLIKIELENDLLDVKAMEKFKELSTTSNVINGKSSNKDVEPEPSIKKKQYSLDEATAKLKDLNLNFTVDTLQTNPCMVAVDVRDKSITAMGTADSEHDATVNAMNKVLETLSAGTSFTD